MAETIGYARPKKLRKVLSKDMEEKLNSAIERFKLGRDYRQQEREAIWMASNDQYQAKNQWNAYTDDDPSADLVSVNLSFSTINTLVPFVADENPVFIVHPESEDADSQSAVILSTFMNRVWTSHEVQGQLSLADAVFDNLVFGDGFLKVGYEIVNLPTYDEDGNIIGEDRVKIAHFSVERVSPWDIWIDPYADGIHNARWVCHRILMPGKELKEDDRYKQIDDVDEGAGDLDPSNLSPEDQARFNYLADGWVAVYEFYDIKEQWMVSFLDTGNLAVRYIEGIKCPIVQMPNYRIPNSPYHMGELEQIRSLQNEINKTRSQMMTHRRRNVMKWVIDEQRVDEDALQAMQSGKINDVIKVRANEPLENIIQPIAPTSLQGDMYMIDDRLRADVNEITGVNEYLRGVPQNISRTATEASILEGSTNIRTRHKLLQVETMAMQAGQILLDIIRDVLPLTDFDEMTMFVHGREAERLWRAQGADPQSGDALLTPNPEVFFGRYRVEVERGSTELRNPQIKAQQLMQMTQLMLNATPILQQLGIPFNMKRMLEMWFEAEGIEDVDALFEMDEQQAQMQELALQERQMQAATGGGRPGQGQPNRAATRPPADLVNPSNSGMLPSRDV